MLGQPNIIHAMDADIHNTIMKAHRDKVSLNECIKRLEARGHSNHADYARKLWPLVGEIQGESL